MFRKYVLFSMALIIALSVFAGSWEQVVASGASTVRSWDIVYGKKYDKGIGSAGVSMPSSAFSGTLEIMREPANHQMPAEFTPKFVTRWVNFQVYGADGNKFGTLFGFNYLYFQSTRVLKRLFDEGNLAIYRYDYAKKKWVECPSFTLQKGKKYRIACIAPSFGLYGLATK
jgi:hypothetical protein